MSDEHNAGTQQETVWVVDRVSKPTETAHLYKSCGAISQAVRKPSATDLSDVSDSVEICTRCQNRQESSTQYYSGLTEELINADPGDVGGGFATDGGQSSD